MSADSEPEPVSLPCHDAIAAVASRILPSSVRDAVYHKRRGSITAIERSEPPRPVVFRIGRSVIPENRDDNTSSAVNINPSVSPVGSPSPPTAPPAPSSSPPLLGISLPTRNPGRDSSGSVRGRAEGNESQMGNGYGAFAGTVGRPELGSLRKGSSDIANAKGSWTG